MKKSRTKLIAYDVAAVAAASLLFAAAMNMFVLPADITVGGITGVATIITHFINLPVGFTIIILNIPLIILNTRRYGRGFLLRTLIGTISTSLAIDLATFLPVTVTDPLLCALLGGAAMGASLGILLSRGYTTGGTDLVACLIKRKLPRVPTGSLIMLSDAVVVLTSTVVFGGFDRLLYSIVCIFTMSRIADTLIAGSRRAFLAFVVTSQPERMTSMISERLGRGTTMLSGIGGYTLEPRQIIMCVVGKGELFFLKQAISDVDRSSFVIVLGASEVLGEGFISPDGGSYGLFV